MHLILSFILISAFSFAMQNCQRAATTTARPETAKNETVKANLNSAPKTDEHGHEDNAPRITLADAKKDFDSGKAVFVDTRSADAFKLERIKGAINVTSGDFEARYKEIPTNKKIIVYCS